MIERKLFAELKPYRRQWGMIAALQAGISVLTVVIAYCLAAVMAGVVFSGMTIREVVPFLAVLLFVVCGKAFFRWQLDVRAYGIAVQVQEKFRKRLLQQLCLSLGPIGLTGEKAGELSACLTDGVDALEDFFTKFVPLCLAAAIMPLLILAVALPEDFIAGLVFLITAPLIPVFMFLIGKRAETANRRQWHTLAKLSADFLDLLEGLTLLKIFNQSRRCREEVAALSENFRSSTMKVLRVAFLSAFALELTATLSVAIVAVSIGLRLLSGQVIFEQALFVLLLAPEFYQPLRQMGGAFHQALAGSVAAARLYGILAQPPVLPEGKDGVHLAEGSPVVTFDGVNFSYQAEQGDALQNLCFTAEAGKVTAFVGLSGAGKSTVFQLLLGFAQPQSGRIYINREPLTSLAMQAFRHRIAYLPQEPYLFSMSVAENIALGKPRASREEIVMAAKQAQIHPFIMALPEGYETMLGDGGRAVSGGQRQRIAIARAFLQDADLILLDELYSGLDASAGKQVGDTLRSLTCGKTVMIVTHHLGQAARADKVIVMAQGSAAESGTHDELLKKGGLYAALWANEGGREDD